MDTGKRTNIKNTMNCTPEMSSRCLHVNLKKFTTFGKKCAVCHTRIWKCWDAKKCRDCKIFVHNSCIIASVVNKRCLHTDTTKGFANKFNVWKFWKAKGCRECGIAGHGSCDIVPGANSTNLLDQTMTTTINGSYIVPGANNTIQPDEFMATDNTLLYVVPRLWPWTNITTVTIDCRIGMNHLTVMVSHGYELTTTMFTRIFERPQARPGNWNPSLLSPAMPPVVRPRRKTATKYDVLGQINAHLQSANQSTVGRARRNIPTETRDRRQMTTVTTTMCPATENADRQQVTRTVQRATTVARDDRLGPNNARQSANQPDVGRVSRNWKRSQPIVTTGMCSTTAYGDPKPGRNTDGHQSARTVQRTTTVARDDRLGPNNACQSANQPDVGRVGRNRNRVPAIQMTTEYPASVTGYPDPSQNTYEQQTVWHRTGVRDGVLGRNNVHLSANQPAVGQIVRDDPVATGDRRRAPARTAVYPAATTGNLESTTSRNFNKQRLRRRTGHVHHPATTGDQ